MFVVEKPHIDYTSHAEVKICKFEECESAGMCHCSYCMCCSACSGQYNCQFTVHDSIKMMIRILNLGDERYRLGLYFKTIYLLNVHMYRFVERFMWDSISDSDDSSNVGSDDSRDNDSNNA